MRTLLVAVVAVALASLWPVQPAAQQAAPTGGGGAEAAGESDEDVVDAEYTRE